MPYKLVNLEKNQSCINVSTYSPAVWGTEHFQTSQNCLSCPISVNTLPQNTTMYILFSLRSCLLIGQFINMEMGSVCLCLTPSTQPYFSELRQLASHIGGHCIFIAVWRFTERLHHHLGFCYMCTLWDDYSCGLLFRHETSISLGYIPKGRLLVCRTDVCFILIYVLPERRC